MHLFFIYIKKIGSTSTGADFLAELKKKQPTAAAP